MSRIATILVASLVALVAIIGVGEVPLSSASPVEMVSSSSNCKGHSERKRCKKPGKARVSTKDLTDAGAEAAAAVAAALVVVALAAAI